MILRLFRQNDPFNEIDARPLGEGDLTIGRDPDAGWILDDPECELSRIHCALRLEGRRLTLRDTSTNGVFLGEESERLAPGEAIVLRPGESFRLGQYIVLVDDAQRGGRADGAASASFAMPEGDAVGAKAISRRSPREAAQAKAGAANVGAILDAFCAGAQIDSSTLTGEDPAELARRIGAIYHQAVVGLCALMHERTVARSEHEMERTTVGAAANNPFKWAPTQRVAVDLLRPRDTMFLSGPDAIEASFDDLRKHLVCVEAAASAALAATLAALSPERIEANLDGGGFLRNKNSDAWRQYQQVHAEMAASGGEGGAVGDAFRAAYERRLQELEKDA